MNKELFNLSAISSRVISDVPGARHIFFGVDNKFIPHALITMMSISEKSAGCTYNFHIISSDITEKDAVIFDQILAGTPHGLTLHFAGQDLFSSLPTTALFTRATYYRLLAPLLVPHAEKILYLDADMVCISSPDALWSFSFADNEIAMVVGEIESLQPDLAASVGLQGKSYFNAGMMLINVSSWNVADVSGEALSQLTVPGKKLKYLDQDALNIVLEGRVRYINRRYNAIEMLSHDEIGYRTDVQPDTCIIHYAGADKPWQEWNQQNICLYYRDIYKRSPFADRPFDLPKNPQQAKRMYKTMFRSHRFLRGLYWRFRYYQMRYF